MESNHHEGREPARSAAAQRVLGIDPGSATTGFGLVERSGARVVHVAHGTIRLPRTGSLTSRLARLHREVAELAQRYRPDVASIEQCFVAVSPRSALVLGQARGAALAALGGAGVAVVEYAPAHIKLSVAGSGRAGKDQIQRVVARVLDLSSWPAADAADALAAALCHAMAGRLELLAQRPRARRQRSRGPVVRVRRVS
ncbi:MAG TPA: crossover junction endodeoxyribonuclease RuvC [Myxococcota bacterium]|nr:crossover junction endodeoxyribonuclease RuvC [Myxococcota bacterium]